MKKLNRQERFEFLFDLIASNKCNTLLNIGYRTSSNPFFLSEIQKRKVKLAILEIWEPNLKQIKPNFCNDLIHMDCRNIDQLNRTFDCIYWSHGPEHILWDEFLSTNKKIEEKADKLVIYECPNGLFEQGTMYNNPYEKHVQTLYPNQFEQLGYIVQLSMVGVGNNIKNITAYKRINK